MPRSFRRSIVLIIVGLLHLIAFGAASILASHITTTDQEVLVTRGAYCGPWADIPDDQLTSDERLMEVLYNDLTMQRSASYVQNCLLQPQALPECQLFKKAELPWNSTQDNPCPFGDLCVGPTNGSLYLDTGLLDSRDDLGINGEGGDRVLWRKNMTCSPITTKGYSSQGKTTMVNYERQFEGSVDVNYTAVFYGDPFVTPATLGIADPTLAHATYIYTDYMEAKFWKLSGSVNMMYDME